MKTSKHRETRDLGYIITASRQDGLGVAQTEGVLYQSNLELTVAGILLRLEN